MKLSKELKSAFLEILKPRHLLKFLKIQRSKKKLKKVRSDAQLKLYSEMLSGDFLHYGYFENPDINIIIILKDKPNAIIEKELVNDLYKNVEIFLFKNLTFNITKHDDMPKCIPLSESEIKEISEKYDTKLSKFPKMLSTDPIARYYGIKSGGMFKIIRSSPSYGKYITYRHVR